MFRSHSFGGRGRPEDFGGWHGCRARFDRRPVDPRDVFAMAAFGLHPFDGPRHGAGFGRGPGGPGFGPRGGRGGHGGPDGHGGPGGHGGGHGGGRGRGLGRFFAHGDLRLVVLHLIAEKPRHGYEIIKAIEDRVAGAYSPSPGVVYPTLTMLEEIGYVTVTEAAGKKLHDITDLGRAFLDANRPTLDALLTRMDEVGGGARPRAGMHVFEAMDRLKRALRQQLARPDVDEAKVAAAVAAIEAAAAAVEGLE